MKKQFFRVKQLADQTFLRAEKSKQLSDELQEADQKVEYLRIALAAVSKRLPQYNNLAQEKDNYEKRMRKLIEYQLGLVMKEHGSKKEENLSDQEDNSLLRPILHKCGKAQIELAREMTEHEIKIENMVSQPIQAVLENEIPAILKSKRTLSKLVLDKDSANNRYQTASKHGTKNESLRDEMEEAEQKVEHWRDSLAVDMFSLLRRESDFAQYMLQLVKLQRAYHESALHTLEQLIPELEKEIGDSPVKAVYGCALEEHLRLSRRQIALPLELCVCALWELGMREEGLFRVAGGTSRVRRMKLSLDSGCFSPPLQLEYRDVHVIASALKSYLRELPEPLLTYQLYDEFLRSSRLPTEEQRLDALGQVLVRLPRANHDNLRYLVKFLAELSKNPRNKMTSSNIAIVIAPNLLWSIHDMNAGIDMASAQLVNSIIDALIMHVDRFFPGNLQVYQTFKKEDLFPDLTEFERPTVASHLRASSNDTALIQLDNSPDTNSNQSSPPQGSPKPISRKKNKPAPIPPGTVTISNNNSTNNNNNNNHEKPPLKPVAYPSGSSTINRVTYRQAKSEAPASETAMSLNGRSPSNKMSVSVGTSDEISSVNRRKSLDFEQHKTHINKCDISSPISTETTANIDSLKSAELPTNIQQITAQTGTIGKIKISTESKQQRNAFIPVAAPRPSLVTAKPAQSPNELEMDGEFVQLRRSSRGDPVVIPGKPVVPERPATLRPSSFRVSKQCLTTSDSGNVENPPSSSAALERTHVYNVADKQQVSFVQFQQQQREKGHDTQMMEKEKFLLFNHTIDSNNYNNNHLLEDLSHETCKKLSVGSGSSIGSKFDFVIPETTSTNNGNGAPSRPPKPELMKSLERLDMSVNNQRSHVRTLSDGDLIDTSGSGSPTQQSIPPASPRACARPPRPQPPPPPPPIRPKSEGESTDL